MTMSCLFPSQAFAATSLVLVEVMALLLLRLVERYMILSFSTRSSSEALIARNYSTKSTSMFLGIRDCETPLQDCTIQRPTNNRVRYLDFYAAEMRWDILLTSSPPALLDFEKKSSN
ncbi:hypothetical protein J6590_035865 [Homalodisca vitripennis]|nr:hypothetical protein J6590_035865 [Homalodisca vitripennis]